MRVKLRKRASGQALVEYVLVLLMVVMATRLVLGYLPGQLQRLERFMTDQYASSYRYGDSRTKGPDGDSGGYEMHPRVTTAGNFRIWKRAENNVAVRR